MRSTQLADAGFETWAMTPAADSDRHLAARLAPERLAIVLGAEGPGLSRPGTRRGGRRVRHPDPIADVDSLNVAAAAAVTFAVVSRR